MTTMATVVAVRAEVAQGSAAGGKVVTVMMMSTAQRVKALVEVAGPRAVLLAARRVELAVKRHKVARVAQLVA
jgi:hypothetical protein